MSDVADYEAPAPETVGRERIRGGFVARQVTVVGTELVGGALVSRVNVDDPYWRDPEAAPHRAETDQLDASLREHPEWEAPRLVGGHLDIESLNPAAQLLYAGHASSIAWREMVPGALSLTSMYWPEIAELPRPGHVAIDEHFRAYCRWSLDATGIRTRAAVVADRVEALALEPGSRWVSIASGAAIPVLQAIGSDSGVRVDLIDIDEAALDFATDLAVANGHVEGVDVVTHRRNIVRGMIVTTELVDDLGAATADVVDMIGIFEYFDDASAVALLREGLRLVKPGGALLLANMLSTRPQLDWNQRGIGWPHIHPRSLDEFVQLVASAGVDPGAVQLVVPQDGLYAVAEVRKPALEAV